MSKRKADSDLGRVSKSYATSFKSEYTIAFPCLTKAKDPTSAHCTVCNVDFKVSHGGRDDCRKHVSSKKHTTLAHAATSSTSINSFFIPKNSSLDDSIIKAETLFTAFLVEHNIALTASDHASALFKKMFLVPGLNPKDIIEKYSCARTKTTAIVHELATDTRSGLAAYLKNNPFNIATDGSNDSKDKLYPLVVRFADQFHEVRTELLSILDLHGKGTGANIAEMISTELASLNIPWDNCLSMCTDNTNSMIGNKTGLYGCLRLKQKELYSTGCVCHRIHLAAEWASKEISGGINADSFFQDIYYFMEKSANRLQNFQLCQEEAGTDLHKVPKHVATRWLSLGKVTKWALAQWEPLLNFFTTECELDKKERKACSEDVVVRHDRKKNVLEQLKSRSSKLYLLFLNFMIPVFEKYNLILQSEDSKVHKQRRLMCAFIRELMVMCVKPSAMVHNKQVEDVDLSSSYNLKDPKDITVGQAVKDYIKSSGLDGEKINQFFQSARKFILVAIKYSLKNLPLKEPVLLNAEVADIARKESSSFKEISFFINKFPVMLPENSSLDELEQEFNCFQADLLPAEILTQERADHQWQGLCQLKDTLGQPKYKSLPRLMVRILSIPHSNAASERVFSMVRKNRTDFRSNMSVDTLQSLMVVKQNLIDSKTKCYERQLPVELLRKCKSATSRSLSSAEK